MPLHFLTRGGLCLALGAQIDQISFAPCASVPAGGELLWLQVGAQLKLSGSDWCLAPSGSVRWLHWLVPQRLALAPCAASQHHWASIDPLCDFRGTCYGRLGSRPHPLAVRNREETLFGQQVRPSSLVLFSLAAGFFALLALVARLVHDAHVRARVASALAIAHQAAAGELNAERAVAGSPHGGAAGAHRGDVNSPLCSPATSSAGSSASVDELTPGVGCALQHLPLSPIDEQQPLRVGADEGVTAVCSPLSDQTNRMAPAGTGSAYKVWKAPRPPGASDSSSSGGSSIARPEAEEAGSGGDGASKAQGAPSRVEGYIVMRPGERPPLSLRGSSSGKTSAESKPRDKSSKKKKPHGADHAASSPGCAAAAAAASASATNAAASASEQLMRAVVSAVEVLSPARLASRLSGGGAMPLASLAAAPAAPAAPPPPAAAAAAEEEEPSSSDDEQPAAGYGLRGGLQKAWLDRDQRIYTRKFGPVEQHKQFCARCSKSIVQMCADSPRLTSIECSDCHLVWHPKCLPSGDKRRPRVYICNSCIERKKQTAKLAAQSRR